VSSDVYYSGAPKFTYVNARKLKKEQRKLSRKTKGSNSYEKQRIKVAKVHAHIANCRKDFLHKETTKIIKSYDFIYIEDLNVKGMLRNRKLSKAVADVGIFELTRQLEYKANWYQKKVVKISRWYPSTQLCSNCNTRHKMSLGIRVMKCDYCGLNLDRDLNAAINIKAAGEVVLAGGVPNQLVKAELKLCGERGDAEPRM
jgi:putative transposase